MIKEIQMGKTMRWLKRILRGKKEENKDRNAKSSNLEVGEKRRWSFGKPKSSVTVCHCEEKNINDQEKNESEAAIKIQKAFRGHLARKALRALKSLVKIQALVRGFLVRKEMERRIYRLESLIQAQALNMNPLKTRKSFDKISNDTRNLTPSHNRRQSTNFDSPKLGFSSSPKIIEIDTCQLRSHSSRLSSRYDSSKHIFSPLPLKSPYRLSNDYVYRSKTTMNTPRCTAFETDSPVHSDGILKRILRQQGQPSYMADTRSSVAKMRVRSQSTPRRISLDELEIKKGGFVADVNRRSCSEAKGKGERFEARDYYYLDRMW
ncbi:hypothetical protein LUZ60_008374 [Juncus effusus]|nr:hypothetical protein LUZ60_008374 [Juncus effusus]